MIPKPDWVFGAALEAAPETARGRVDGPSRAEPGVPGDSVPILDFRAALRGVIFPLMDGEAASSRAGDRVLGRGSRRIVVAGEVGSEPASRGVKVLFVPRKLELSVGVNGFAFCCLSMGMLRDGACRDFGR